MKYFIIATLVFIFIIHFVAISHENKTICFPADTCHNIGVNHYNSGNFIESIKYSKAAENLRIVNNDELVWKSWRNIGLAYYEMDLYKEANNYFLKSYNAKGNKNSNNNVQLLRNIGDCYSEIGELNQALEYATQAIKVPQATKYSLSIAHGILAKILRESKDSIQIQESIRHSKVAIKMSREIGNKKNIEYATMVMGNALNKIGLYDEALEIYRIALKDTIAIDNSKYKSTLINNTATVLIDKQNYQLAEDQLNKSLTILKNHHNTPFHYDYAALYENLADNYTVTEKYDSALLNYQKSLINLTNKVFGNKNIFQNPNLEDSTLFVYSYLDIIRVLHLKASAAFQYYQKNKNEKYLTLASQTYQTAFNFHDELQKEISTENSRLFQAKNIVPYIENALNVACELQKEEQEVGKSAFRFMEKNKSTVLLQSMNEADALQYANLPDSLLTQEKDLKIALSYYSKQLNEAIEYEEADEIEHLRNLQFEEKQQYDQLINHLEENYPDYYNLKYQQNTTHLSNIQKQLNEQKAILEYFVGDSSIFILSIQKHKSTLYKLQKPNNWDSVVDKFLSTFNVDSINTCYEDDHDPFLFNDFTINATQLFESLLAQPLEDLGKGNKITHLQIIPDAKLNYVPFELLLTNNDFPKEQVDYRNLPYLIKEKTISYAYSAALLLEDKGNIDQSYKYNYAGFAPYYDDNKPYLPLNATKGNVTNISSTPNRISFVDDEATENNFKDTIQLCQTFQFAGHGDIDDKNPLNSKLIFTKTNDTTDYELHAYELYNLEIPAQLGVLSACETGLGKTAKGEGIMSLSRAFTYAGCNSLVMSLWSIYDKQTADIVEHFFTHLKKGKAKDDALRQAKLDYLQNPETKAGFTHPIYWAGLVQIGDTSPVTFEDNYYYYWLLLAIVLLLALAFLFLKRKN